MKHMLVVGSLFSVLAQAAPLTGVWKLDKFTMFLESGEAKPFCLGVQGAIVYGADGNMSVQITCRTYWGYPAEAYGGFLFYAGNYEKRDGVVSHRITRSNNQALIGTTLVRKIEVLTPHRLVLTGKFGKNQSLNIQFRR